MDEEIFKITKDEDRAKDLFIMAKERIDDLSALNKNRPYKIIEEYYEIIKELLTSIMYIDGFKTLSHKKLIDYFSENYSDLNSFQIKMINNLRKFRNDIVYYGKKISQDFLINNEDDIKKIINVLIGVVKKKM